MPTNWTKGSSRKEVAWAKAKKIVHTQYPDVKEPSERFYKLAMSIAEKIAGGNQTESFDYLTELVKQIDELTTSADVVPAVGDAGPGAVSGPVPIIGGGFFGYPGMSIKDYFDRFEKRLQGPPAAAIQNKGPKSRLKAKKTTGAIIQIRRDFPGNE